MTCSRTLLGRRQQRGRTLDLIWGRWENDEKPINGDMQWQQKDAGKAELQEAGATTKKHEGSKVEVSVHAVGSQ